MQIDQDDIIKALAEVLESETFIRSKIASKFLSYIVKEHLAGRGDQLSEVTVAQNVFDKGPDYDPKLESNVRVTAGRIRKMLRLHYSENKPASDIIITIPKGSYSPSFSTTAHLESATLQADKEPILRRKISNAVPKKAIIFASGAIICLATMIIVWPEFLKNDTAISSLNSKTVRTQIDTKDQERASTQVAVALFENKTGLESYDFLENALQSKTADNLSLYSLLKAVPYTSPYEALISDANGPYQYVASAIILSVEPEADIIFKLYDKKKYNSVIYEKRVQRTSKADNYFTILSGIIDEVTATALMTVRSQQLNTAKEDINAGKRAAIELEPFECMSLFNTALDNRDPVLYKQGYICLQALLANKKKDDEAALLAYLGIMTFVGDRNPIYKAHEIDANINAEQGIDMLLKSIEIKPFYSTSHYFLSQAYSQIGKHALALKHAQLGHLANPASNANLTLLSQQLAANNEWERALPLANKAIERNSNPRGNYYRTAFAYALLNKDKEAMDDISKAVEQTGYYYSDLFLFLSAVINEDQETLKKLRPNVVKLASENYHAYNKDTHTIAHWIALFGNQDVYSIARELLIRGGVFTDNGDIIPASSQLSTSL